MPRAVVKNAGVAELADARDLKSRDTRVAYRFDPGFRHQKQGTGEADGFASREPVRIEYRGVEQLGSSSGS